MSRALYLLACGAEPARDLATLAALAVARGWQVCPGSTPAGHEFLDVERLADVTGRTPRCGYSGRSSGWPPADGIVVAPATLNTVNKIAAGITDTWAVNVVIECMGLGVPVVIAPNVNPALGRHPRFRANLTELRTWGAAVLWHPDGYNPPQWMVPWHHMLDELERRVASPG